ncbi:MAG: hypothetical protein COT17_06405 [Elusimicrobia bacterium CG08_land_8_20_14_0_20_51_18]|nr:MAG: hypothetical protein COT17_06405 [Elusimicrobia bacterium CG08_land_8_20_14_0_20_51_18]
MNEIIKTEQPGKDYVEAELLDEKYYGERNGPGYGRGENPSPPENGNIFIRTLDKARKTVFVFLLTVSFLLIVLGSVLSLTFIGAIIGIPLILLGIFTLFIAIKLFSGKIIVR